MHWCTDASSTSKVTWLTNQRSARVSYLTNGVLGSKVSQTPPSPVQSDALGSGPRMRLPDLSKMRKTVLIAWKYWSGPAAPFVSGGITSLPENGRLSFMAAPSKLRNGSSADGP